jgi:hypothetical protein
MKKNITATEIRAREAAMSARLVEAEAVLLRPQLDLITEVLTRDRVKRKIKQDEASG